MSQDLLKELQETAESVRLASQRGRIDNKKRHISPRDENQAAEMIKGLPEKMKKIAKEGGYEIRIIKLEPTRHYKDSIGWPTSEGELDVDELENDAFLVALWLEEQGLSISIDFEEHPSEPKGLIREFIDLLKCNFEEEGDYFLIATWYPDEEE